MSLTRENIVRGAQDGRWSHSSGQDILDLWDRFKDAEAERNAAVLWIQHLEGLIARTVKRTISDTGWCPVCDGHHAPVEDWHKDCPAWKNRPGSGAPIPTEPACTACEGSGPSSLPQPSRKRT